MQAQRQADSIGLQNDELKKLRYAFMQIDYDESGEVDADEFLEFVDERRSPFTDHIFKAFDSDGSGEVDFNEFIGVCCTYCMYSKQQIRASRLTHLTMTMAGHSTKRSL